MKLIIGGAAQGKRAYVKTAYRIAEMCIRDSCLYNTSSRKRKDHLWRDCENLLQYKDENTVAGLAQNVGRPGESMRLLTLRELKECETDMFTIVFVGSSKTRVIGGRMVTPRG